MDKCPICDGTGTSNTCVNGTFKPCSFCDGTGECDANEVDRFNAVDFIKVMEMVKNPQTNEEWLRTATTEQLADKLTDFSFWLVPTIPTEDKREQIRKRIVEWLKEKHNESV